MLSTDLIVYYRICKYFRFINNWLNVTKPLFKFIFLSRKPYHHRITFVKLFVEILCCAADYDILFEIYSWLQVKYL